ENGPPENRGSADGTRFSLGLRHRCHPLPRCTKLLPVPECHGSVSRAWQVCIANVWPAQRTLPRLCIRSRSAQRTLHGLHIQFLVRTADPTWRVPLALPVLHSTIRHYPP